MMRVINLRRLCIHSYWNASAALLLLVCSSSAALRVTWEALAIPSPNRIRDGTFIGTGMEAMQKLAVISWDEAGAPDGAAAIGWWGGFFEQGMRGQDYLDKFNPKVHPYLEAARKSAIENKIKVTGEQHQWDAITPVFSDGRFFQMTYRAWGDFMAAVWSEEEDRNMSYTDFYVGAAEMNQIIYHGVKVRWNDGSSEMFRYATEEQAREAEHYQFVENWKATKSATYVGRRIHLAGLWHFISNRAE